MKEQKPITHIVRSKDAAGFYHYTRCGSLAEAVTKRRDMQANHGHLSAIIITVEPVTIPTSSGPVIAYKPAQDAPTKRPALHRQAVR